MHSNRIKYWKSGWRRKCTCQIDRLISILFHWFHDRKIIVVSTSVRLFELRKSVDFERFSLAAIVTALLLLLLLFQCESKTPRINIIWYAVSWYRNWTDSANMQSTQSNERKYTRKSKCKRVLFCIWKFNYYRRRRRRQRSTRSNRLLNPVKFNKTFINIFVYRSHDHFSLVFHYLRLVSSQTPQSLNILTAKHRL